MSGCGPPYRLWSPQGSTAIDGCAGTLGGTPATLVIKVGQRFRIASVTEQDGTPDFRAPTTDDPAVVIRTGVSGRGGEGRYRAVSTGVATLVTSLPFCEMGPAVSTPTTGRLTVRTCPVLEVTVTG